MAGGPLWCALNGMGPPGMQLAHNSEGGSAPVLPICDQTLKGAIDAPANIEAVENRTRRGTRKPPRHHRQHGSFPQALGARLSSASTGESLATLSPARVSGEGSEVTPTPRRVVNGLAHDHSPRADPWEEGEADFEEEQEQLSEQEEEEKQVDPEEGDEQEVEGGEAGLVAWEEKQVDSEEEEPDADAEKEVDFEEEEEEEQDSQEEE
ncbi:hypothetical protein FN846DRAFT_892766 [Sphaerosporella brunnea]|uniref:Uncharacterized protein n=1 Tax=Sphaerosporella brunnea TaxID=1250544 RepID=A0A5J5ENZ7_9PEZI|nr:hypothetical protein FN846DRAFT_892766 [Sphaerosporella brunnea]